MREEKVFRLGRLAIDGPMIEFEREDPLAFEAARRDALSVGVHYDYREATPDKETVHIRLTAHVEGQPARSHEAVIHDSPLFDDSRRGFVSVPIQVGSAGMLRGRFTVETRYGSGPWRGETDREEQARAEGEFTIDVR